MLIALTKWFGLRVALGLLPVAANGLNLALSGKVGEISTASLCGRGELLIVICAICAGAIGELVSVSMPKRLDKYRVAFATACLLAIAASALGFGMVLSQLSSNPNYSKPLAALYSIAVYCLGLLSALGAVVLVEANKPKTIEPSGAMGPAPEDVQLLREIRDALKK